jgi:dipeptidyl aminopeptidase/acylaminoacyl peptidase
VAACPDDAAAETRVVYADAGDLWLYDLATDGRRRLTADDAARFGHAPSFVTAGCIAHVNTEPLTIEVRELSVDGSSRVIVEESGVIASLDISPDGRSIAYLQVDHDVDSAIRLKLVDMASGVSVVAHTFNAALGRGAGSEDEVSVAWSPDGSAILVANTHEYTEQDPNGALSLFDATGREISRWAGTHPRWSPDGRSIYFRGFAGVDGPWWSALDVATLTSTRLGVRPGTNGLAASPDGRYVAYDTSSFGDFPSEAAIGGGGPSVYAFDLVTGEEKLLGRGAMAPRWISDTAVIVTDCKGPAPDSWNSWTSLGTVSRISIFGDRSPLNMTSTFDATVYLGR